MTPSAHEIRAATDIPCEDHGEKRAATGPEAGAGVGTGEINMSSGARPITREAERRVVRKIDKFLMPAMMIGTSRNTSPI